MRWLPARAKNKDEKMKISKVEGKVSLLGYRISILYERILFAVRQTVSMNMERKLMRIWQPGWGCVCSLSSLSRLFVVRARDCMLMRFSRAHQTSSPEPRSASKYWKEISFYFPFLSRRGPLFEVRSYAPHIASLPPDATPFLTPTSSTESPSNTT